MNDLRLGLPVLLTSKGKGTLILAIESASDARLEESLSMPGTVLAITARRAKTLKATPYDGEIARIRIVSGVGSKWVRSVADPSTDLMFPMKGPFATEREGEAEPYRAGILFARRSRLLPAILARPVSDSARLASQHNLVCLDLDLINVRMIDVRLPIFVAGANLPIEVSDGTRIHVFRVEGGSEEHCAIEIGEPPRDEPVLTRLHSACFTGDVLGSLKCDCGKQLKRSLETIGAARRGLLLYLNQEGRGIGLVNKVRAYSLQDQGFDTVEANHRLGFEDDERNYRVGAEIIESMGFSAVELMTNNPAKVAMMTECGIEVTKRVSLRIDPGPFNVHYLGTKVEKSGHIP